MSDEGRHPLKSHLQEVLSDREQRGGCAGVAAAGRAGEEIFFSAVGDTTGPTGAAPTRSTRFLIGSLTKQFTAMLVLQLVEQGKLNLQDGVLKHLSDAGSRAWDGITIHHLLSHTSGLADYTELPTYRDDEDGILEPSQLIRRFSSVPPLFQAGKEFRYCNSNYVLLGTILERATGRTFSELLNERILNPAGMQNTGYDPESIEEIGIIPGYRRDGSRLS